MKQIATQRSKQWAPGEGGWPDTQSSEREMAENRGVG